MHEDSKESALALRMRQSNRYISLALIGILALCALLFMNVMTIKQSEAVAQQNQQVQAQAILESTACKDHPEQQMCAMAHQSIADPAQALSPTDTQAITAAGREVKTFALNKEGNLVVTYTDGSSGTIGRVTGAPSGTEAVQASP